MPFNPTAIQASLDRRFRSVTLAPVKPVVEEQLHVSFDHASEALHWRDVAMGHTTLQFAAPVDYEQRSGVHEQLLSSVRSASWGYVENVLDEIQAHGKPVLTADDRPSALDAENAAAVIVARCVDGRAAQVWLHHERCAAAEVYLAEADVDEEREFLSQLDPEEEPMEFDNAIAYVEHHERLAEAIREGVWDPTPLPDPDEIRTSGRVRRAFQAPSGERRALPEPSFDSERWTGYVASATSRRDYWPVTLTLPDGQAFSTGRWFTSDLDQPVRARGEALADARERFVARQRARWTKDPRSLWQRRCPLSIQASMLRIWPQWPVGAVHGFHTPRTHGSADVALSARRDRLVTDHALPRVLWGVTYTDDCVRVTRAGVSARLVESVATFRYAAVLDGTLRVKPNSTRRNRFVIRTPRIHHVGGTGVAKLAPSLIARLAKGDRKVALARKASVNSPRHYERYVELRLWLAVLERSDRAIDEALVAQINALAG